MRLGGQTVGVKFFSLHISIHIYILVLSLFLQSRTGVSAPAPASTILGFDALPAFFFLLNSCLGPLRCCSCPCCQITILVVGGLNSCAPMLFMVRSTRGLLFFPPSLSVIERHALQCLSTISDDSWSIHRSPSRSFPPLFEGIWTRSEASART